MACFQEQYPFISSNLKLIKFRSCDINCRVMTCFYMLNMFIQNNAFWTHAINLFKELKCWLNCEENAVPLQKTCVQFPAVMSCVSQLSVNLTTGTLVPLTCSCNFIPIPTHLTYIKMIKIVIKYFYLTFVEFIYISTVDFYMFFHLKAIHQSLFITLVYDVCVNTQRSEDNIQELVTTLN